MPAAILRYPVLHSLVILIAFSACVDSTEAPSRSNFNSIEQISAGSITHAKGFRIIHGEGYTLLDVFSPWKRAEDTMHYCLVPKSADAQLFSDATVLIRTPVTSIVCLSTTHLGFIDLLGRNNTLKGIAGTKWVNNAEINKMIGDGEIKDVGIDNHLNYELILDLQPDLVFAYGIEGHSLGFMHKLKEFGIPTVIVSEYMETDPLGKAEWIKFIAAFFELNSLADEQFEQIRKRYTVVKELVAQPSSRPTVLTGLPWKGDWFVPGGRSFQAQLIEDAGANYVWNENEDRSGMIVDIEVVFERAVDADFWINLNDYHTMSEVLSLDHRYENFKAVKNGALYNNNFRQNEQLGNDYWESGVVQPDVILKDLVKIFHPELMNEHQFFYYQQIR